MKLRAYDDVTVLEPDDIEPEVDTDDAEAQTPKPLIYGADGKPLRRES